MTLTEDLQKLLELRQFYLAQVAQFYQQIQEWGKDKLKFTPPEDYPIYDKTGEYQSQQLTAEIIKKNADGLKGIIDFFPHGITFLTEEGVIGLHGSFDEEELIYMQREKLWYTERNGQTVPRDEGFEADGWYWMEFERGNTKMHRLTEGVFWEVVGRCTDYSQEELS
jgi:hypothetical protein